jgi:hypothetical protein
LALGFLIGQEEINLSANGLELRLIQDGLAQFDGLLRHDGFLRFRCHKISNGFNLA